MRKSFILRIGTDYFPFSKRQIKEYLNDTDFSKEERRDILKAVSKGKMVNFCKNEKDKNKWERTTHSIFKFQI